MEISEFVQLNSKFCKQVILVFKWKVMFIN